MNKLFTVTYGSKLYGTSTPTSDTDLKTVFMPSTRQLLLAKKLQITKDRFFEDGTKVPDKASMPANGLEEEFFPLHTFVRDFVQGQTYAVEMVNAFVQHQQVTLHGNDLQKAWVLNLMDELYSQFATAEVGSMVGFAMKQTFDYVKRGERLNKAREVLQALEDAFQMAGGGVVVTVNSEKSELVFPKTHEELRLDHVFRTGGTVLDFVANETNTPVGSCENNNKMLRTLELNGRSYLETTSAASLVRALNKLVDSYGERTNKAAETDVDYKSLSHAVRVYQQSLEVLDGKLVQFPRPNAQYLLSVKEGKEDFESVKKLLLDLDDEVEKRVKLPTNLQKNSPELAVKLDDWFYEKLEEYFF